MCEFCEVDGLCMHSGDKVHDNPCVCALSGPVICPECGHSCMPWYSGLQLPQRADLMDNLRENVFLEGTPLLSKSDLVKRVSAYSPEEAAWLSSNLPDGKFTDPGDVIVSLFPLLQSPGENADYGLVWRHPLTSLATGMKLRVKDQETGVMIEGDGKNMADVFSSGNYVLSLANSPKLASKSRRPAEGFSKAVFSGYPLFISQSEGIQVDISSMSLSPSKKMGVIQGKGKISVSTPAAFVSFYLSLQETDRANLGATVKNRINDMVGAIIGQQDLEVLKQNKGVITNVISENLSIWGLKISLDIDYVGEATPEMMKQAQSQMMDYRNNVIQMAAQLRQQMQARTVYNQPPVKTNLETNLSPPSSNAESPRQISCEKCGFKNPASSRFCGNCGSSLVVKVKICPKCGQNSAPNTLFCGNCGTKLG
jgi:ribosomal protein L40E